MYWIMMNEHFKEAYNKAVEVLNKIGFQYEKMIPTADIIEAVEQMTQVNVKFREFDFGKLDTPKTHGAFSRYGAAMYVSTEGPNREAKILLNKRETPEMKRFSLVHELGHLILGNMQRFDDSYLFSTHIDMDITSISEQQTKDDEFLMGEQMANIFALVVLIPFESMVEAMKKYDSLDMIAEIFGVEKTAVVSRMMLGINMGV